MRAYSKQLLHYQITNNVIVRVLRILTKENVTASECLGLTSRKKPTTETTTN
jgi:hypothetical protein